MARPFVIKRNDLSRSLKYYLKASPASDFTGATAVFNMMDQFGSVKVERGTATLGSDAGGDYAQYDWASGDTDTSGTFRGEFEVLLSNGRPETYPNGDYIPIRIPNDIA